MSLSYVMGMILCGELMIGLVIAMVYWRWLWKESRGIDTEDQSMARKYKALNVAYDALNDQWHASRSVYMGTLEALNDQNAALTAELETLRKVRGPQWAHIETVYDPTIDLLNQITFYRTSLITALDLLEKALYPKETHVTPS